MTFIQWDTINIILNRERLKSQFKKLLLDFDERCHELNYKKGFYIYGSPGCGKTEFVKTILKEIDYDSIWYDAGDVRNKGLIDTITSNNISKCNVLTMMQQKKKNIVIVMDEIDGMNNGDKGGIASLIKLIRQKKTKKQQLDDDDYYPPERIEHAVDMLQKHPKALCAGSSELYIYFKHVQKMYQFGPYGPNHATAGTFAFRKELLSMTYYNNDACLAEEKEFLHNYSIPFIQLDPLRTILVFSHNQNTFDKKKLLENINPTYVKESNKEIKLFIKYDYEDDIKDFFVNMIDDKLKDYAPGEPTMKPDVLEQMKVLEEQRRKAEEEQLAKMNQMKQIQSITTKNANNESVQLSIHDAVNIMNKQNKEIIELKKKVKELEEQLKNRD